MRGPDQGREGSEGGAALGLFQRKVREFLVRNGREIHETKGDGDTSTSRACGARSFRNLDSVHHTLESWIKWGPGLGFGLSFGPGLLQPATAGKGSDMSLDVAMLVTFIFT